MAIDNAEIWQMQPRDVPASGKLSQADRAGAQSQSDDISAVEIATIHEGVKRKMFHRLTFDRIRLATQPGFTLVELLVVIAVIGMLVGILLPAVNSSREAARRIHCSNNVRNHVLAVLNYESAHQHFPAGRLIYDDMQHSWILEALAYLEEAALERRYDRQLPWFSQPGNLSVADTVLPIFRCPSSIVEFPGDTDYGGMMGSILTSSTWDEATNNGIMATIRLPQDRPITMAKVKDGASRTICVAESADRLADEGGRWISGDNCFSHDNGPVNPGHGGEIFSQHRTGAHVGFADGSTAYLSQSTDPYVVGALCTRAGHERVNPHDY
jgi:prepilin-type N-terminal cleavage/methylation domain-containing protein